MEKEAHTASAIVDELTSRKIRAQSLNDKQPKGCEGQLAAPLYNLFPSHSLDGVSTLTDEHRTDSF